MCDKEVGFSALLHDPLCFALDSYVQCIIQCTIPVVHMSPPQGQP